MQDFLSFIAAKNFIKEQATKLTRDQYQLWVRENKLEFLPTNASRVYKDRWFGWSDYLGNLRKTYKLSAEDKSRMSETRIGVAKTVEHLEKMKASQQDKRSETRQKTAKALTGLTRSEETKGKIKVARAHQVFTEESNRKRSISVSIAKTGVKRKPFSAEWCHKLGDVTRDKPRHPDLVEKTRIGLTGRKHSDEQREINRRSHAKFVSSRDETNRQFKAIWGDLYDYDLFEAPNAHTPSTIVCRIDGHGQFQKAVTNHRNLKQGCPFCAREMQQPPNTISKVSQLWLDSLGVPDDDDHREVVITFPDKRWIRVDGYDRQTQTIYEFHGDYWHGNPNKFPGDQINRRTKKPMKELHEATQLRSKRIRDAGYVLIEIWEEDWKRTGYPHGFVEWLESHRAA